MLYEQIRSYYRKRAERRNRDGLVIHVSDINRDFCLRRFLLCSERGLPWRIERKFDMGILMAFRIGEKIEEIIRECLERYVLDENFFKLSVGRFTIQGSADIVVRTKRGKMILEVKSINRSNFEVLQRALPEHEFQLQSYLYLSQLVGEGFLRHGYVIYVAKEYTPQPIKLFRVELNDLVKDFYEGLVEGLRLYERHKILPKRCQRGCFLSDICLKEGG